LSESEKREIPEKHRFKCFNCEHLKEHKEISYFFNVETGGLEPFTDLRYECEILHMSLKELMKQKIGYDCAHYKPKEG